MTNPNPFDWMRLIETSLVAALFFYHMYALTPRLDKIITLAERNTENK